jgi:Orthopoxvirus protein of unknown function (DUF830).
MTRYALLLLILGLGSAQGADIPPLKTGDIVFQTTATGQSAAIMFASSSLYTHMGIIELDRNGTPLVVEAVGPVRTIPFEKWLDKGVGRRVTIKRVKGLSEGVAQNALARAHHYDGRPYDLFFYETRDSIYCSELVHAAFKEGAELVLGTEEKVSNLKIDNLAVRRLIRRWRQHPACQSRKSANFNACFKLILNQTLVTPASIARDPKLELIYTNFGPEAGER